MEHRSVRKMIRLVLLVCSTEEERESENGNFSFRVFTQHRTSFYQATRSIIIIATEDVMP